MIDSKTLLRTARIAAVALLPAACADKPADQSGTQGMDMQTMMTQCADMRRQMAQATHPNTPDMTRMMTQCDEMDRSMSAMPGMGSAAPAGTRSR